MFKFPFTNFHELNLDWILSVVKEAKEVFDTGRTDIDAALSTAEEAKEIAQQAAAGVIPDYSITSNKLAADSVTVDKLAAGTIIRDNILENWFFKSPYLVNQRGQTIYTGAGYCIDRWKNASINNRIEVTDEGLKVVNTSPSSAGTINQFLTSEISGRMVTGTLFFSNGVVRSGSGVFPAAGGNNVTLVNRTGNPAGCVLENHDGVGPCFTITTNPNSEFTLVAVKLELGEHQTLARQYNGVNVVNNFPHIGDTLSRCHRFYWRGGQFERVRTTYIGQNSIQFFIPTPETMARRPDIDGSLIVESLTGTVQEDFTFSVLYIAPNGIGISAAKNSHGLTDAILRLNQTAFIAEENI